MPLCCASALQIHSCVVLVTTTSCSSCRCLYTPVAADKCPSATRKLSTEPSTCSPTDPVSAPSGIWNSTSSAMLTLRFDTWPYAAFIEVTICCCCIRINLVTGLVVWMMAWLASSVVSHASSCNACASMASANIWALVAASSALHSG